jgi:hypothetical protein
MPTREDELIARARELQRLLTQRRKLRRQLRAVDADVRHVRKMLKALKAESEQRRPDAAPSRLHAGVTACGVSGENVRKSELSAAPDIELHQLFDDNVDGGGAASEAVAFLERLDTHDEEKR